MSNENHNKHNISELYQMQALPLYLKIALTKDRIRGWLDSYDAYVSFSGGKDSTVLLHLCREVDPSIPAVYVDTGLEYPELREFVKTVENVTWLKPKMNFRQVIEKYGYPVISKEVAECVYGAKKYVKKLIEKQGADFEGGVRQTIPYHIGTDMTDYSDLANIVVNERTWGGVENNRPTTEEIDNLALSNPTRGGQDNKYRKLRGLGEYSSDIQENQQYRRTHRQFQSAKSSRNIAEEGQSDSGEYP